eukprot:TRINITY_DN2125_c0_g4_i1.p1 TRINITY_DN2125_c0_g4~~TRINITY_DN2125_c0_g4_i1.p1  ORF type:complete len:328 (+),score=66.85 TRINITY_DN2125_c0_g4_i1:122-1105(+)
MAENLNEKKPDQEPFRFFSLSHPNKLGLGFNGFSQNPPSPPPPPPPPPPCVEVLLSNPEVSSSSVKYTMESIYLIGDLTLHKGRVSTKDVFGVSNSDLVPGKYEGGLKLWEGSLDLVKTLYNESQEGKLSLKGKRVLELGCGHGLPGIFTCLEGAAVIHFQDFNAEVLQCLTIPNVKANLAKDPLLQHSSHTNEMEKKTSSEIRFFAGDWSEIHKLLSHNSDSECQQGPESSSNHDCRDGYDIILMAETVYSLSSLHNLYELIKKCLSRPLGVVYLAAKKHYFGVGGGTRQFRHIVAEDGIMEACLIAEVADGSSNVREVWKFTLRQ